MKIYNDISTFKQWCQDKDIAVTIGNFDGIHLGHKDLLEDFQHLAKMKNFEPVIITFDPHQALFFSPDKRLLLNSYEKKLEVLAGLGFKHLLLLKFDCELQKMHARDFLSSFVFNIPTLKMIYTGYDFALGKSKDGGVKLVQELSPESVEVVEGKQFLLNGDELSSSFIRELLLRGDIQKTNHLLVANHSIEGIVKKGNQNGRAFGFPTANLNISKNVLIPCSGVYAGSVLYENRKYKCAINIGTRPSVTNDTEVTVEAHIIDFDKDIYGERIALTLLDKLRNEKKFDTKNELIKQVKADIQTVKSSDV